MHRADIDANVVNNYCRRLMDIAKDRVSHVLTFSTRMWVRWVFMPSTRKSVGTEAVMTLRHSQARRGPQCSEWDSFDEERTLDRSAQDVLNELVRVTEELGGYAELASRPTRGDE